MKLWILKPKSIEPGTPWHEWYDKSFGFIIRAETESDAREIAQNNGGCETWCTVPNKKIPAWTDTTLSDCVELTADGDPEMLMQDFAQA